MSAWDDATEDVLSEKARAGFQAAKDARVEQRESDLFGVLPVTGAPTFTADTLLEDLQKYPLGSLHVNVEFLDLLERYNEEKAFEILGKLKDLLA